MSQKDEIPRDEGQQLWEIFHMNIEGCILKDVGRETSVVAFVVQASTSTISTSICDNNIESETWWWDDGVTSIGKKKAEPPLKVSFDVASDPKTVLPLDGAWAVQQTYHEDAGWMDACSEKGHQAKKELKLLMGYLIGNVEFFFALFRSSEILL